MKKDNALTDCGVQAILALAGPTMMEQLMNTAVQYVDTAMVGSAVPFRLWESAFWH